METQQVSNIIIIYETFHETNKRWLFRSFVLQFTSSWLSPYPKRENAKSHSNTKFIAYFQTFLIMTEHTQNWCCICHTQETLSQKWQTNKASPNSGGGLCKVTTSYQYVTLFSICRSLKIIIHDHSICNCDKTDAYIIHPLQRALVRRDRRWRDDIKIQIDWWRRTNTSVCIRHSFSVDPGFCSKNASIISVC